jgi:preprotein translocase subunit SecY
MQVNPEKIADNFSKSGAYIPGIRPGKETEKYISKVLNRVILMGAGFITLIAVLPYILQIVMGYFSEYAANLASGFGGTSIIIVVGVALETVKEIEGRMAGKDYSGLSMNNTY